MTKDELKEKFDKHLGMVSEVIDDGICQSKLVYKTSTGVTIAEIHITNTNFDEAGGWKFGGHSTAFPGSWTDFCRMND